jgi:alkylation response protein AidB-like acyl-CoA dehydrogenase
MRSGRISVESARIWIARPSTNAIVCREVFFDEVFVPDSYRLGDEGQGFRGLMRTFDIARIVLAAAATGAARAAYEYALKYARDRKRFASRSSSTRPWHSGWPTWRPGSSPRGC